MKLTDKNLVYITFNVILLAALFSSGCSVANHVPNTATPVVTPEIPIHVIALDNAKETPSAAITPTPQPIVDNVASLGSVAADDHANDTPAYSDVRKQCTFAVSSNRSTFFYVRDASMESTWQSGKGEQSITVEVQSNIIRRISTIDNMHMEKISTSLTIKSGPDHCEFLLSEF